jgi:ribosomal protein S18 acetylase RimI-like enzyme
MHDADAIWRILEPIIRAGETYALPPEMNREDALAYWFSSGHEVFVAQDAGEIVGTYYLRANQQGGGAHVANCAYMTAPWASGRGVGRAMAAHSLAQAKARGFTAMQFNFVIASNGRAIRLWEQLGFQTIGRRPAAFRYPSGAFIDVLVMHRTL